MKLVVLFPLLIAGCASAPPAELDAHWQPSNTGSDASLRGIAVVDATTVWATGSGGTVLRTTDAGATWSALPIPGFESAGIRDVQAFDAERAFVLAITDPACILRTEDGGASWDEVHRSPHDEAFLDSIVFFDETHACAFGDPIDGEFLVLTSDDGGASWERVAPERLPDAGPKEAGFAASGTCVVAHGDSAWIGTGGHTTRILSSVDRGRSWLASATPMLDGRDTSGIYSVGFRDSKHGVVVGGDYTKPDETERNAARSEDGGLTWTAVEEGQGPSGHRASVVHLAGSKRTWITAGRAGTDYSLDDGRTWQPIEGPGYFALDCDPTGVVWAVGSEGRAARLVLE